MRWFIWWIILRNGLKLKLNKEVTPESLYYAEIQKYLNVDSLNGLAEKNIINRIFSCRMPEAYVRKMNKEYFDNEFYKISLEVAVNIIVEKN